MKRAAEGGGGGGSVALSTVGVRWSYFNGWLGERRREGVGSDGYVVVQQEGRGGWLLYTVR